MKLKEFINQLNRLAQDNPKTLDFNVITTFDEDFRMYEQVNGNPSVGHFNNGTFIDQNKRTNDEEINAVLIHDFWKCFED